MVYDMHEKHRVIIWLAYVVYMEIAFSKTD